METKVLVVEDDDHLREVLLQAATLEGYQALAVSSAEAAIERLERESFDILLTDVNLPQMSGLDLLPQCVRLQQRIVAIVMTAFGTIDVAVEAMKRGASDFLVKPFELSTLLVALKVAVGRVPAKSADTDKITRESGIIADSAAMRKLFEQ